jgi:hypothetical protein
MATPIAQAAINTFLQLSDGNSPETLATVANVGDITGPTFQGAVVDVTSHSTGNAWRQKIVTLLDPGTLSFPCFFIPNDSGHKRLLGVFFNRGLPTLPQANCDWALSFPTSPRTVWNFSAWMSKFSMDMKVADVVRAGTELVLTGEPAIPGVDA